MGDWQDFDLSLFGSDDGAVDLDPRTKRAADRVLLELKSADAAASAEEQRLLLDEMMRELRAQFIAFRDLRAKAEALAEQGDEVAQKLARADLKAASDAMNLIVRTLEKVDSLQRQMLRDREEQEERQANETGYGQAVEEVERLIEERARELFEQWKRGDGGACPSGSGAHGDQPPDGGGGGGAEGFGGVQSAHD